MEKEIIEMIRESAHVCFDSNVNAFHHYTGIHHHHLVVV